MRLRHRIEASAYRRDDGPQAGKKPAGFTLIELMVVLLIIGILMAIAIPTYLSERNKADNTAAMSDLRTALTTLKSMYAEYGSFYNVLPWNGPFTALQAAEPAIEWSSLSSGSPDQVAVTRPAPGMKNAVVAVARSGSGRCFWFMDVETPTAAIIGDTLFNSESITGPGVWYATGSPGGPGGSCELGLNSPGSWSRSTGTGW